MVIGKDVYAVFPLTGDAVVGRSESAEITIPHRSVSRRHARISVGPPLSVQDLGGRNGTRVSDLVLHNDSTTFAEGEAIELGDVIVIVQARLGSTPPRRVWVHGYFETRLESECDRARNGGHGLAVVRLRCAADADERVIEGVLFDAVDSTHVIGRYAPRQYELLLLDVTPEDTQRAADHIAHALSAAGVRWGMGTACYPRDGSSAGELIERAGLGAHGVAAPAHHEHATATGAGMERVYRLVHKIARGTITVLVLGETGVGKEVVAEAIHRASPRAERPLLKLNCAAFPESLLESELFGHERGAFTGANEAKRGLLEAADGGTVLLDEVGEMPLSTQAKLLRVLEDGSVLRVGSVTPRSLDVRFVCATNRDLEAESAKGRFRPDLYFRLNGVTVVVPPLRHRSDEIEPLARLFLREAAEQNGLPEPEISREALELLHRYSWPGNIRELRNFIERALLLCNEDAIRPEHFPLEKMDATFTRSEPAAPTQPPAADPNLPLDERMKRDQQAIERRYIQEALSRTSGNQREAAKLLGMARRTLQYRVAEYGLKGWKLREDDP